MIAGKPISSKYRSAWIMTRFDEKAVNFEGLAWREMSSENIKQHLMDALLALSALHKIHIAHKDAFMRNLVRLSGSDGDNSATRYIDFEYARSFRDYVEQVNHGEDILRAQGYINRSVQGDLRSLLIDAISVLANQLNQSPADRWKLLEKCLDSYQEMMSASGNSTALREAADHAINTLQRDYM
jgi:serine/threonine protein kinase